MAFKLSTVEVKSKKSHEIKQTSRGKKFTIAQEKLGKLLLTDKFNTLIGTFEGQEGTNEYNFKHKGDNVEWTITTKNNTWQLNHKGDNVAVVSNPDNKFVIKLRKGTKYGEDDVWVGFDEANSSFKLERGQRDGGFVFAVYRSDDGEIGSSGGKVEITRGERRNFVLVLACLVLFIKQKGVKKVQRHSMPVGSSLGLQAEAQGKPKRARSNSVDGEGKGKSADAKKPPAKDEKVDAGITKKPSGTFKDEKSDTKVSGKSERTPKASSPSKKKHGKGKQGKHEKKEKKRRRSTESDSGSFYSESTSDSTTETSDSESSSKKKKGKGKGKSGKPESPRKPKGKANGKGKSETPRKVKDAEKDKTDDKSTKYNDLIQKSMQTLENQGKEPVTVTATVSTPAVEAGGVISTNGSGGLSATISSPPTAFAPLPSVPSQPAPAPTTPAPTPAITPLPPTAVVVPLSDNQYLLNINGLDRSKKTNISIQLMVDGVPLAGSPWEYKV
jgi:hypothetical protein